MSLETYWNASLTYTISPRCGPMRQMRTLRDVSHALQSDLPKDMLKQRDWLDVGLLLVRASETGAPHDVQAATDHLVDLIDKQGWMDRAPAAMAIRVSH